MENRRHEPLQSGYFASSAACAPVPAVISAAVGAVATRMVEPRPNMMILPHAGWLVDRVLIAIRPAGKKILRVYRARKGATVKQERCCSTESRRVALILKRDPWQLFE